MHRFATNIYVAGTAVGREMGCTVMRLKRANVCWPMVFDGGFRVRDSGCGN